MSDTATEEKNLLEMQDRLMKMLDSVRLDPNASPEDRPAFGSQQTPQKSAESVLNSPVSAGGRTRTCPSCRSQEPWGSSSWCPKCGYYPKLKRRIISSELAEMEFQEGVEEEEDLDVLTMAQMVPGWIYWLTGGLMLLLIESLTIRILIPVLEHRSPLAILQCVLGFNVLGIAHIRAYLIASEENEDLNFISIFWSPSVLWKTALMRMPEIRKTVYAGAWGAAAILFAVMFIEIDYASVMQPENFRSGKAFNPMKAVMSVARTMATAAPPPVNGRTQSIEEALEGFAEDAPVEMLVEAGSTEKDPLKIETLPRVDQTSDEENKENDRPDSNLIWSNFPLTEFRSGNDEYIVIGYLTNSSGELRSLLLAETLEQTGAIRFGGKYTISINDPEFINQFQKTLEKYRMRTPAMQTPYIAKWTAPYVYCKIVHNGIAPDGRFVDGQILYFRERTTSR